MQRIVNWTKDAMERVTELVRQQPKHKAKKRYNARQKLGYDKAQHCCYFIVYIDIQKNMRASTKYGNRDKTRMD